MKITHKRRSRKAIFKTISCNYQMKDIKPQDIQAISQGLDSLTLETQLNTVETNVISILKAHDIPHVWPDFSEHLANKYDYPQEISYALDILFHILNLRNWIEKGHAQNAAAEGIRIGRLVTQFEAEMLVTQKGKQDTTKGRIKREKNMLQRQKLLKELATEKYMWKQNNILTLQNWKSLKALLKDKYPEYSNVSSKTFTEDGKKTGIYLPKKR